MSQRNTEIKNVLLYSNKVPINPITSATAVTTAVGDNSTVEKCLQELYAYMSKSEGDDAAVANIIVNATYARTTIDNLLDIKDPDIHWGDFILPNELNPYTWKKTSISYKGSTDFKIFYEIVSTDISEKHETIYLSTSTDSAKINYSKKDKLDEKGNPIPIDPSRPELGYQQEDDYSCFDKFLPGSKEDSNDNRPWSLTPLAINPHTEFGYMAIRHKNTKDSIKTYGIGKWTPYEVALYARWPSDSTTEVRYKNTDDPSDLDKTSPSPIGWEEEFPGEYTGKLWMITATRVKDEYITYSGDNIWHNPILIAYIK